MLSAMKSILSKRDISVMCLRFSHGQAMAVRDRGWKLFQSYQVMICDLPGLLFMYASHILSSFGLCLGAIVSILDLGKNPLLFLCNMYLYQRIRNVGINQDKVKDVMKLHNQELNLFAKNIHKVLHQHL